VLHHGRLPALSIREAPAIVQGKPHHPGRRTSTSSAWRQLASCARLRE